MREARVISKNQAIKIAVEFCQTKDRPTVYPVLDRICEGLMGLSLAAAEQPTEFMYYPLGVPEDFWVPKELTKQSIEDRVNFIAFFDDHPESLIYHDQPAGGCHIVDVEHGVLAFVPAWLIHQSASLACVTNQFLANNNQAEVDLIREISELAYNLPPLKPKDEPGKEELPPTPFKFMSEATELVVRDRLDVIKFFDDIYHKNEARAAAVKNSEDRCLVSTERGAYSYISEGLIKRYRSIELLLESKTTTSAGFIVDRENLIIKN